MRPLVGTPVYQKYWEMRSKQLTDRLIEEGLTEEERTKLEYEIDLIYAERCRHHAELEQEDVCATCDEGICTNGCQA